MRRGWGNGKEERKKAGKNRKKARCKRGKVPRWSNTDGIDTADIAYNTDTRQQDLKKRPRTPPTLFLHKNRVSGG